MGTILPSLCQSRREKKNNPLLTRLDQPFPEVFPSGDARLQVPANHGADEKIGKKTKTINVIFAKKGIHRLHSFQNGGKKKKSQHIAISAVNLRWPDVDQDNICWRDFADRL